MYLHYTKTDNKQQISKDELTFNKEIPEEKPIVTCSVLTRISCKSNIQNIVRKLI